MSQRHVSNQINSRAGHQVEARTSHQGLVPPSSEAVSVMTVNKHTTNTQSRLMYEHFIQYLEKN